MEGNIHCVGTSIRNYKNVSTPLETARPKAPWARSAGVVSNGAIESGNGSENPAIRQSAIFDKISGFSGKSVQLKDIVSLFPEVSERTLRYDLQRLCADGKIERVGQGGPATHYKARVL